ncbi:MAG: lamin tail domain-containing protein [Anaerolineales bacterium]
MERRRLFPYLLLNVLVSAVVTGSILYFYDRAYRADCGRAPLIPTLPLPANATPLADQVHVDIVSIIGAGSPVSEIVVIQNNGQEAVVLTGWRLQDSDGAVYLFPQLTLHPGASVQVHTASGTDTAIDLYWGGSTSLWQAGEIASLYDSQGILRALYRVP